MFVFFCDISKAFDRVWHKGFLFKLQQNGTNGCLLNWVKCYLIKQATSSNCRHCEVKANEISGGRSIKLSSQPSIIFYLC